MIHNNVLVTVRNETDIALIRELLTEQCRLSREEPGCVKFDVFHSQADRKLFFLVESWSNQETLDQHRLAKAYVEIYKPKVLPLVDRTPHPCDLLM